DVEQCRVRFELFRERERLGTGERGACLASFELEHARPALRAIAIVVGDQYATTLDGASMRVPGTCIGRYLKCSRRRDRQIDAELAAETDTGASSGDLSAMQLHKSLHEREPDAETAFGAFERGHCLREHLE